MIDRQEKILPLFPLPDTILFPGQILPLHIFEPRYRQMIRDLLDGPGEMVIGTVLGDDQQQLAEQAPVQSIAGVGRLERYQELADGRFMIVLLGKRRVTIEPWFPEQIYPMARITEINDTCPGLAPNLREQLLEALAKCGVDEAIPQNAAESQIADIVLMSTPLSSEERYRIYSVFPTERRIERVLEVVNRSAH